MGKGVAEVFDDVEGHRDVQAGEGAGGALGVDARDHGVVAAVDQVDARIHARAGERQAREARGVGDHGAGELQAWP